MEEKVEVGRPLTPEEQKEYGETMYDVPMLMCTENAYELPGVVSEDFNATSFIGNSRIGHVFLARRKGDVFETLGENSVLATAREEGVQSLGHVVVKDVDDKMWLLMSYFAKTYINALEAYHIFCQAKKLGIELPFEEEGTFSHKLRGSWATCLKLMWLAKHTQWAAWFLEHPLRNEQIIHRGTSITPGDIVTMNVPNVGQMLMAAMTRRVGIVEYKRFGNRAIPEERAATAEYVSKKFEELYNPDAPEIAEYE